MTTTPVLPTPLLTLRDVEVRYEAAIVALRGVSLSVPKGSIVALLGANGAGKSTTLKAVLGLIVAERGALTAGDIVYRGTSLVGVSPRKRVLAGMAQVLEGRRCFPNLTIEENLRSGTLSASVTRKELARRLERIYAYFPRLKEKRHSPAGYASGGEQQMVALGRALASEPSLVLLDEPSMGLAPKVVSELFEIVRRLNEQEGVTFLLAEQNANLALRYASYAYVLENGRVSLDAPSEVLRDHEDVRALYLGTRAPAREASAHV